MTRIRKNKMHRSNILNDVCKDLFEIKFSKNIKKENIIINPIPNLSFANWGNDSEAKTMLIKTINNVNNELLCLNKFETGLVIKRTDFQRKEFFIVSFDQLSNFFKLKIWFMISTLSLRAKRSNLIRI